MIYLLFLWWFAGIILFLSIYLIDKEQGDKFSEYQNWINLLLVVVLGLLGLLWIPIGYWLLWKSCRK